MYEYRSLGVWQPEHKTSQSSPPGDDFKWKPTVLVEITWRRAAAGGGSVFQPIDAATTELVNYKKLF
jgi:hypothetical protein